MTGNKLVPTIILEGTRLTFKTGIAFELNGHPRAVDHMADWMESTGGLWMKD